MSEPDYRDTVTRLRDALRQRFGSQFASYYDGDPEAIPLFNLPALIVDQTGEDDAEGAMNQADVTDRITVKLVFNKRDDFKNDKAAEVETTTKKLRELVGRRNQETGLYDKMTVKSVIRSLPMPSALVVADQMTTEYGIQPRPVGEGWADLTAEAHVSFSIQYSVDIDQQ